MPAGFRARRILFATVTEYVATGKPVSSRKLARRYDLKLSPASIRNVLGDLEEEGFLVQPHTSAGRVPTDMGFRAFVDALVQVGDVAVADQQAIMARLSTLRPAKDDVALEASRILSSLTGAASVLASALLPASALPLLLLLATAPPGLSIACASGLSLSSNSLRHLASILWRDEMKCNRINRSNGGA